MSKFGNLFVGVQGRSEYFLVPPPDYASYEFRAGDGDDYLSSSYGNDVLLGEGGSDLIEPFDGDDLIFGDYATDETPSGQAPGAADHVNAGLGNDTIFGGAGGDYLTGDIGDDVVLGGADGDYILGGPGSDFVDGGAGDDILFGSGPFTPDASRRLTITYFFDGTFDTPYPTEKIGNGAGGIIGNLDSSPDIVFGGAGNDFILGSYGNDRVAGDDGSDVVLGSLGDDIVEGGAGDDVAVGQEGNDLVLGGDGGDVMDGGSENDILDGGGQNDFIGGGTGNDIIGGGDGNDFVFGAEGNDFINAGSGTDLVFGAQNTDTLLGGLDSDVFYYRGGDGTDVILDFTAGNTADVIDLIGTEYGSFAQVQARLSFFAAGNATVLSFSGGAQLLIANVRPEQLDASDFWFNIY